MPDSEYIQSHKDEYSGLYSLYLAVHNYFVYGKTPRDRKAMKEAMDKLTNYYEREKREKRMP